MVADVNADKKTRALIGTPQGSEHFKKVIQRIALTGNRTSDAFAVREFRQQFGNIVSHGALLNICPLKDISHQDVEIEPAGDAQTALPLEEGMEKSLIIQDQVSRSFIGKQLDEAL